MYVASGSGRPASSIPKPPPAGSKGIEGPARASRGRFAEILKVSPAASPPGRRHPRVRLQFVGEGEVHQIAELPVTQRKTLFCLAMQDSKACLLADIHRKSVAAHDAEQPDQCLRLLSDELFHPLSQDERN